MEPITVVTILSLLTAALAVGLVLYVRYTDKHGEG